MDTGWEGGSCRALKLTNNIVTNLFWKNEKNIFDRETCLVQGVKLKKNKTGWQTCAVGILITARCEQEILSRHSNLLKKYTVLEKKKNFSYNELPRYFLPNDKFTCIFGVFDIVSLSSACRENWFTILIDLRRIFMRI